MSSSRSVTGDFFSGFLILTMWNDTDTPLAYFISFRTYGTWLHGDKRGSIDRFHNRYRSPYIPPNAKWHRYNQQQLKDRSVNPGGEATQSDRSCNSENLQNPQLVAFGVQRSHKSRPHCGDCQS